MTGTIALMNPGDTGAPLVSILLAAGQALTVFDRVAATLEDAGNHARAVLA